MPFSDYAFIAEYLWGTMMTSEETKKRLISIMKDMSPESLWKLTGELYALKTALKLQKRRSKERIERAIEDTLDVVRDFYEFNVELQSEITSKDFNEVASMFDLTAIGTLAAQDVITHLNGRLLPTLLMSAISEGLIFLGSRQYVAGAQKIIEARLSIHSHRVYERLWELPLNFKKELSEEEIRKLQASIDEFFEELLRKDLPLLPKVAVLLQFYSLVLVISVERLLLAL